jgi:hypothetical protein
VQLAPPEKLPEPELEKLTVPLGVLWPELAVSLTVALHVLGASARSDEGVHSTVVAVGSR